MMQKISLNLGKVVIGLFVVVLVVACSGNAAEPAASNTPAAVATNTTAASTAETAVSPTVEPTTAANAETATAVNSKLNLNEATGDEYLATIPDFPDRMVREFLEYRPYVSILQFRREIGKYVGDDQVAVYEQYVYVPVDVDESDSATLQQLPGVDETIATELINGRPYSTNEAFLAKLGEYVSADDVTLAAAYLTTK